MTVGERVAKDRDPPDVRVFPLGADVLPTCESLSVSSERADELNFAIGDPSRACRGREDAIASNGIKLNRTLGVFQNEDRVTPPGEPSQRGDDGLDDQIWNEYQYEEEEQLL